MKPQSLVLLITLSIFNIIDNSFAQAGIIRIKGKYQVRQFVSYDQVQKKDYKGTGSWVKFPCANCPVIIINKANSQDIESAFSVERMLRVKKDTSLTKIGAYLTYTDKNGEFNCRLKEFKSGKEVYVFYGNSKAYKRKVKLNNNTDAGVYTQK